MKQEQFPHSADQSIEQQLKNFDPIDGMPETSAAEVRAKRNACNDAVIALEDLVLNIHSESGEKSDPESLDDAAPGESEAGRGRDLANPKIDHFRTEMVRLGNKLELLEKKAA